MERRPEKCRWRPGWNLQTGPAYVKIRRCKCSTIFKVYSKLKFIVCRHTVGGHTVETERNLLQKSVQGMTSQLKWVSHTWPKIKNFWTKMQSYNFQRQWVKKKHKTKKLAYFFPSCHVSLFASRAQPSLKANSRVVRKSLFHLKLPTWNSGIQML